MSSLSHQFDVRLFLPIVYLLQRNTCVREYLFSFILIWSRDRFVWDDSPHYVHYLAFLNSKRLCVVRSTINARPFLFWSDLDLFESFLLCEAQFFLLSLPYCLSIVTSPLHFHISLVSSIVLPSLFTLTREERKKKSALYSRPATCFLISLVLMKLSTVAYAVLVF